MLCFCRVLCVFPGNSCAEQAQSLFFPTCVPSLCLPDLAQWCKVRMLSGPLSRNVGQKGSSALKWSGDTMTSTSQALKRFLLRQSVPPPKHRLLHKSIREGSCLLPVGSCRPLLIDQRRCTESERHATPCNHPEITQHGSTASFTRRQNKSLLLAVRMALIGSGLGTVL